LSSYIIAGHASNPLDCSVLVQGQYCQPKSSFFGTCPKKQEKISFYLISEQAEKFDDLAYTHIPQFESRMAS
jgi:hypothetical protein